MGIVTADGKRKSTGTDKYRTDEHCRAIGRRNVMQLRSIDREEEIVMPDCCRNIQTSFGRIQESEVKGRNAKQTVHQKGVIGSHSWDCGLPQIPEYRDTGEGHICVGDKVTHKFQIFPEDWRESLHA